ncbi:MAG: MBOAT family protein [Flavobacteriales bacterium]|nr:MBOAT family protein [Flavobacteriales bacterium]
MVFSSSIFLLYFLPIFLLVYQLTPRKFKNIVILLASIFFYSWGAPKFVFVILGSTIVDFFIVKTLYESDDALKRKILLGSSIFINLGLLMYFKYANFFVENVNAILASAGIEEMKWVSVVLPIGISFYTFQTLTYSIDIYRKIHAPLKKVTDYLLYIMSFPQMIAGPIVRFRSIAGQITDREDTIDDKLIGFYRFSIGLAKKVLIANVMAEQADAIFNVDNLEEISTASAWLGMFAYTFQIYFDFSGYSDMAIGLGRMMGFRFPENFNSPYIAKSISEFWRRWHITLGDFMRDYLYIPLGGNKVSTTRMYINLGAVFLLSGLWHGASWNFVIWGAYHGIFLILDRLFLIKFYKLIGNYAANLITFFIVMIGWVIFRMEDFDEMKIYLVKLFAFDTSLEPLEFISGFKFMFVFSILFSFIVNFKWGEKLEAYFFQNDNYNLLEYFIIISVCVFLFVISVSSITSSGFNPFIYFRF